MSHESAPVEAQPKSAPAAVADADAKEAPRASFDAKADGGSMAGSGGPIKEAAPAHHSHAGDVDLTAAITANCTAAWRGDTAALRDAKEHLYEVGVVVVDGERCALFHVPDGADKASKDRKPYRLLPLSAIVEPPAPPKAVVNPDESYYDEPKSGETHKPLPKHFAYFRAPVFYAAAAGRRDVIDTLLTRHRDCGADRARIYTAKAKAGGQWEIQENAADTATTPKPKFVDAAAVARANGFDDAAQALEKSYRACSTEDCSVM